MTVRTRVGLLFALASAALLLLAGPAEAAKPWWRLTSASRPSYLNPGSGANEIQEVTVNASGGEFALARLTQQQLKQEELFTPPPAEEPRFASFPVGAAASVVQAGLEGEGLYGPGNVEVAGPDGGPYTITFSGDLANHHVPLINTALGTLFFGLEGEEQATEKAEGRYDGEIYVTAENLGTAEVAAGAQFEDVLPPNWTAMAITATEPEVEANFLNRRLIPCELASLTCTLANPLAPYDSVEMQIAVNAEPGATSGELNEITASGGGAQSASLSRPITVSSEPVPFGVDSYEMALEEEGGAADTHAGTHPFQFTTQITLNQGPDLKPPHETEPEVVPLALSKNLDFKLPPGLIGNPEPLVQCTAAQFYTLSNQEIDPESNLCPPQSAVGVITTSLHLPSQHFITVTEPIFNLEPGFGEPARFGFNILIGNSPVIIDTSLRSDGDYGITANVRNIPQISGFLSSTATFWGTPGDPRHDGQRGYGCLHEDRGIAQHNPCPASEGRAPIPFFLLPARCDQPLQANLDYNSWTDRTVQSFLGAFEPVQRLDGCNQLPFAPKVESHASTNQGETGSGFDFTVDFDDEGLNNAEGLIESQTNKAVVTLPEGLTINPSVGEGLGVCSPADYQRETLSSIPGEGCPNSSKLGTLTANSPLIDEAVTGSIYLAQQDDKATTTPGAENPFDSLIALYMVLKNQKLGVISKLPLKVEPDEKTGQLVATLENIPQLPLSHFNFHFREGARAPLITPAACGTYTTEAKFYPWSEPNNPHTVPSSFQITKGVSGGPCPPGGVPPFHPHFEAGAVNNNAGSYSPFNMRLIRSDGEQDMTKFSAVLPPGELGSLAGVAKCPDSAIAIAKSKTGRQEHADPSCPANSLIGHTLAGAGVGEALTYVPGQLYLGGPYHGDPLSVISVTPALAGPFDAGTVVIQLALTLNPKTAEVEVDGANSDPIPHILDGIVLKLRDLRVYVDRPDFTLNPTSCEESSAKATLFGSNLNVFDPSDDVPVGLSSRYQAANCASLGFKPGLSLQLKGGTKRGGHPGLIATYTPRKGDANVKGLVVRLPRSAFLDQAHIRTICTRVQFAAKACPKGAQYGFIKAFTPLLDEPLEGPVWLRSSNHKLPDLVFDLHGLVDVEVSTRIDSANGGIRASIESAPDAPLTKVVLQMQGGKKGLIVNSRNLCGAVSRANVEFEGQNGKESKLNPVMKADCGGKRGHKRHRR